jgi:hypothetical protein
MRRKRADAALGPVGVQATMTDHGPRYARLIAWALLSVCTLAALTRPVIAYDDWWYHLPFSSYLFNIGHGAASFHLDPLLTARWLGFPRAWEWVQGLAWFVSGSLYAVIVPQLILATLRLPDSAHSARVADPRFLCLADAADPFRGVVYGPASGILHRHRLLSRSRAIDAHEACGKCRRPLPLAARGLRDRRLWPGGQYQVPGVALRVVHLRHRGLALSSSS